MEAVIRVSFRTPVDLKFALINEVHRLIKDRFPVIGEPEHIEVAPGLANRSVTMGPGQIHGVVFKSNEGGMLVGLQQHVLAIRWLKVVSNGAPEYPRFPVMKQTLVQVLDALNASLGDQKPLIAVVNMSYVNLLDFPSESSVLEEYFTDLVQVAAFKDADMLHKLELSWRAREETDLRFQLERVTAIDEEDARMGYRLTTVAGAKVVESQEPLGRLDDIHERLQDFFLAAISAHAKDAWQLKVG